VVPPASRQQDMHHTHSLQLGLHNRSSHWEGHRQEDQQSLPEDRLQDHSLESTPQVPS